MSALMRAFLAGQLKYARDVTYFLAPFINSYKRFQVGTFAPTRIVWSRDNRTAGFRILGDGPNSMRSECRVPGADVNPYLAFAAALACGLNGVENKLKLEPAFQGNAYEGLTCDALEWVKSNGGGQIVEPDGFTGAAHIVEDRFGELPRRRPP